MSAIAMLFISLHPQISANPHFTSLSSPSFYFNVSSYIFSNPSKTPIRNHNLNSIQVSSKTNSNIQVSSEFSSHSDTAIKMPTAPWMRGPLLVQPDEVVDFSKPKRRKSFHKAENENSGESLTKKESGVRGKKAMKKIVQSIEKLQKSQNSNETPMEFVEPELQVGLERLTEEENIRIRRRLPWEKDERFVFRRMKKEKKETAAELVLDKALLERLRSEAAGMRKWVKVKKAGVTQDVVDEIKWIWKRNELAMVKFDIPLCRNMDRAQEIVETKTGGLVVWSKKDTLFVYRGFNHLLTSKASPRIDTGYFCTKREAPNNVIWMGLETKDDLVSVRINQSSKNDVLSWKAAHNDLNATAVHYKEEDLNFLSVNGSLYEREGDRLLDGLGPRFIDWWMHKPLPVDADLLPEVVHGFQPPFRLCPPHSRAKLSDNELTYLRKLAHPMPTHFVLGRNKRLQGLAAAILKLWEKSLIAKIAVKFGIPNTNNEEMADELKRLTGGVLLLCNKFIIILYRGKDFLPSSVAALVEKREAELKSFQLQEEVARTRAIEVLSATDEPLENTSTSGTLTEFKRIQTNFENIKKVNVDSKVQWEAEIEKLEKELRKEGWKAFILNEKIKKSARELSKLNAAWTPAEPDVDLEIMTDEERICYLKIGRKMKSCLVLGRRGVFDGVLGSIHQHWKHREVVKVITMQREFTQVLDTANMLERESGGILVSVNKVKEGHAIILYRGKNYRRPLKEVAKNLPTKREALQRSLGMQRIRSLKTVLDQRQQTISHLKLKLADLQQRKESDGTEIESS